MIIPNCLKFLLLLSLGATLAPVFANVSCKVNERQALLELKRNLVDNYGRLSSWDIENEDADCCNWSGVQCNQETGHVEKLELHGDDNPQQPIRGTISTSLMELNYLTVLDLSGNDFMGIPIPEFFGSLSYLGSLNLKQASFGGKIPYQLGMLSSLWYLDLSFNDLEGVIPHQLGNLSSLQQLWFGHNHYLIIDNAEWLSNLSSLVQLGMTGVFNLNVSHNWLQIIGKHPIKLLLLENCSLSDNDLLSVPPSRLNFSTSLEYLDLSGNKFSSVVFPWLFNFNTSLAILYLGNNFLQGPIPYDLGILMSYLRLLDLSSNLLNGTIPHSIGFLSVLENLYLQMNFLEGVIDETIFANLTHFKRLGLSHNSLTLNISNSWVPPFQLLSLELQSCKVGPSFPKWLHTQTNLSRLDISNSQISDTIPEFLFCGHNFTIPSLRQLNISNNQLSGQLPDCWWIPLKLLVFVDLSNNKLSGNIPTSIGSLVQIHQLILRNNSFTGEFPSLENCTELALLDLGENKLSGPIPLWIGNKLQKLETLILRKNRFLGSLPLDLCHLSRIQVLDLSMNNLSGEIPKCINNFTTMAQEISFNDSLNQFFVFDGDGIFQYYLRYDLYLPVTWKGNEVQYKDYKRLLKIIDLSSNQLSGEVPTEIGHLVKLVSLNISRNNLSGEIPSNIGKLGALDFLDLSRNNFTGKIPSSLSQIDRLSVLDLSYNNLSGKIPTGTQLQSFENAYKENPFLCGSPLTKLCPPDQTSQSPSIHEEQGEDEDAFFTQGFYVSLSLGFVIGFWGVFGSLLFTHARRYAYFNSLNNLMGRIHLLTILNTMISRTAT